LIHQTSRNCFTKFKNRNLQDMFFDQVTHILEQKHYICQKGPIDFELNSYPTHIRTYDVNQKIKEK